MERRAPEPRRHAWACRLRRGGRARARHGRRRAATRRRRRGTAAADALRPVQGNRRASADGARAEQGRPSRRPPARGARGRRRALSRPASSGRTARLSRHLRRCSRGKGREGRWPSMPKTPTSHPCSRRSSTPSPRRRAILPLRCRQSSRTWTPPTTWAGWRSAGSWTARFDGARTSRCATRRRRRVSRRSCGGSRSCSASTGSLEPRSTRAPRATCS